MHGQTTERGHGVGFPVHQLSDIVDTREST